MHRKNLAILAIISLCIIAIISIGIVPLSNSHRTITDIKQANVRSASITINTPSSSTSWSAGTTNTIKWTSSGCSNYVTIKLYKDGSYDSTITSSTSNNGEYSWLIPPLISASSRYQIYIIDFSSGAHDYSDYFTITGSIPGFTWIYVILGVVMGIAVIGVLLRQKQNFPRVF